MSDFEPRGLRLETLSAVLLRSLAIALMIATPWWYGSVSWQAQQWIQAAGIAIGLSLAVHVLLAFASGNSVRWPPALSWTLVGLAGWALLQAQTRFPWEDSGSYSPPSVQLQRWALGYDRAPAAIAEDLASAGSGSGTEKLTTPCALESVPASQRYLATSVEPATTRAAAGSLFLAALLVWVGSALFSGRSSYPMLLLAITVLGSLVALYGIVNVLVPSTRGWLGLERSNSFSTFVSRNSAGAFLNIALAAAWGLVLWFSQRARKRMQRHARSGWEGDWDRSILGSLRRFFAKLDALQIASFLATVWIASAVLQSLSRGAAVSGIAAALGVIVLVISRQRSGVMLIGTLLVAALAMAFMVFFQLDERVLTRLESLNEFDMESDSQAGRLYIWNVSLHAARFYGWLGSGLGTFHFASLPFQRPSFTGWYYHAESMYGEILVTMGYLGAIVVAIALVRTFQRICSIYVSERFRDFLPIQTAGIYLFLSQAIHSAVDFALVVPGVYIPAALLMGAALGAKGESHRIVRKWKQSSRDSQLGGDAVDDSLDRSWWIALGSLALAVGSALGLYTSRNATVPLAVAESLQDLFARDDQLEIGKRSDQRLETLVDRAAQGRVSIDQSPQLQYLVAQSLCHDDRQRQWKRRPLGSDPKLAWSESDPFLVGLAYERVDDASRDVWLRSIGGEERLATLRKASAFYAKARAQSPLDWQSLWGNLHTSLDCKPSERVVFAPVMQRTAGHMPQLLTSASILFNATLSEEDRFRMWRTALRTSPAASLGIGRLLAAQYPDGSVPVDLFPDNPRFLYTLAREVFTKSSFPKTHQRLCQRAMDAVPSLSSIKSHQVALLMADIASEAGQSTSEIENLMKYLQFKPEDVQALVRLANLQMRSERWDDADATLRRLRQADRNHPALESLSKKIRSRSIGR